MHVTLPMTKDQTCESANVSVFHRLAKPWHRQLGGDVPCHHVSLAPAARASEREGDGETRTRSG
jgi:hypothetical protein